MKSKEFEKYVESIFEKYKNKLLIADRTFEIKYGLSNSDALMESRTAYPYLSIILDYGDEVVDKWKKKDKTVKWVIIHELCHTITDPLYCKAITRYVSKDEIEDERERLTDKIANIVLFNEK